MIEEADSAKKRDRKIKRLGKQGENAACRYLKRSGYKIIERNYKTRFGEVDIIAQKEDTIAFIEVKTRLTDKFGAPAEAVTFAKQRKYALAAQLYFSQCEDDCIIRFDVIEVFRGEINHIENAFSA